MFVEGEYKHGHGGGSNELASTSSRHEIVSHFKRSSSMFIHVFDTLQQGSYQEKLGKSRRTKLDNKKCRYDMK